MTSVDKIIERLKRLPPEADFGDVRKLVEACGWELHNTVGSHFYYKKAGERPLPIITMKGRRVKRTYLPGILERLGLDD